LIDNKTRDAYDSLLSVRKSFYLSPEDEQVPMTKSYLSKRKENKYCPFYADLKSSKKRLTLISSVDIREDFPKKMVKLEVNLEMRSESCIDQEKFRKLSILSLSFTTLLPKKQNHLKISIRMKERLDK